MIIDLNVGGASVKPLHIGALTVYGNAGPSIVDRLQELSIAMNNVHFGIVRALEFLTHSNTEDIIELRDSKEGRLFFGRLSLLATTKDSVVLVKTMEEVRSLLPKCLNPEPAPPALVMEPALLEINLKDPVVTLMKYMSCNMNLSNVSIKREGSKMLVSANYEGLPSLVRKVNALLYFSPVSTESARKCGTSLSTRKRTVVDKLVILVNTDTKGVMFIFPDNLFVMRILSRLTHTRTVSIDQRRSLLNKLITGVDKINGYSAVNVDFNALTFDLVNDSEYILDRQFAINSLGLVVDSKDELSSIAVPYFNAC